MTSSCSIPEEPMHDPSTSRSNFCLWCTMEMTSSQSCLESYKNWDFRVGNSYHNYLIILPVTRKILDTQESSQLSTRAHFPAIPGQNPLRAQRLWKSHISAAAEDCAEEGLTVGTQDMQSLGGWCQRQQHSSSCSSPARALMRGQAVHRNTHGWNTENSLPAGQYSAEGEFTSMFCNLETSNRSVRSCSW